MSRDAEVIDDHHFVMGTSDCLGARGLHGLMVFPIPLLWTKVAYPVSAGKDFEIQEASVEPAIEPFLIWLSVSAPVLLEDLNPLKLPATGHGPTGRAARTSRQHGGPRWMRVTWLQWP